MPETQVVQFMANANHGAGHEIGYKPSTVRSSTLHPERFKGIRFRPELGRYISEIRPAQPRKRKIWLGTYKTAEEAARAFDAGIFYTKKPITYNFEDSPHTLEPLPEDLTPEQEHIEIQKKAKAAAARAQPVQPHEPAKIGELARLHGYTNYHYSRHFPENNTTQFRIPQEIQFSVVLDRK